MSHASDPLRTRSHTQLDILSFPLKGSRLIEASAGTGKTFTIALLYTRLVLGHGREPPHDQGLTPPEILVMTFTDAATQELRDRIRTRLTEASRYFQQAPATIQDLPYGVDLLHDLRGDYPEACWPACARKLQLAAEWMDEAAVSTIHAWCKRMLREHAFDSDSLFAQTLETDQSDLLAEATRDYWRTFFTPLSREAVNELCDWWANPSELLKDLNPLLSHAETLRATEDPAITLQSRREEKVRILHALKAPWKDWVDELQGILDEAVARKRVDGKKIQPRYYQPWLKELRHWSDSSDDVIWPQEIKKDSKVWERLTPSGMAKAWKVGQLPDHDAFRAIQRLPGQLETLPSARSEVLIHAARWVAKRFASEQERRAWMGFNDLITRPRKALEGPNAERLAAIIRQQFPAALIDEFQDTDPIQYQIFDAIYRVAANADETLLVLIGDPKQAIYAFRGADIHTYLQARHATEGRHYTLKINHRSTTAMVRASNRWFEVAEARKKGSGAFLFRDNAVNPVPFVSAEARGRPDTLWFQRQPLPAMTVWWLPCKENNKKISKEDYYQSMADICASEMVRLLNAGQQGQAGFEQAGTFRPLRPTDIAVLVNKRREADVIRRALMQRGVRSVYLSDHDSVFQTSQAREMLLWLSACAEPDDARRLRAALATATLGQDWAALDRLNHDELYLESLMMQFRGYQVCWQRQGVLPMVRRLLNDFAVPSRWLGAEARCSAGTPDGERILTDVLHLTELLQQASAHLDGEHALIRYLAEQCDDSESQAENDLRQIRLESDSDLVRVVTVHKSKGLEYPLVFLPFAADFQAVCRDNLPLKWHDAAGQLHLCLEPDQETEKKADRERLGEDIRKLYVALTRARHATWLGIAPIGDLHLGALGYLLAGDDIIEPDKLPQFLWELAGSTAEIRVEPAPEPTTERFVAPEIWSIGQARHSRQVAGESWWIASYSALKKSDDQLWNAVQTSVEDHFQEEQEDRWIDSGNVAENSNSFINPFLPGGRFPVALRNIDRSLHGFPAGAEAGIFLHDLMQWAARQGFDSVSGNPDAVRDLIARRCQLRGWTQYIDSLHDWMLTFMTISLNIPAINGMISTQITLAGLSSVMAEMEFWLPAYRTDTRMIDTLVCRHTLDATERPELVPRLVNGMLKGFIDLVFEHEGRYYVMDYKSNRLGLDDSTYTSATMRALILKERYDLQYVLYLLALHRHLKSRLPGYRYERHIGGAIYVFLRGLQAPGQGLHIECPPAALIEQLDALLVSRRETV
ncbi:RecBCD enzyme subunit RecB [Gammaproteobacteria bacterium]